MSNPEEEEEEQASSTKGRPNSYFAHLRDEDPDAYDARFRAVPSPGRGGAKHVGPEQTLGTEEFCWCSQPAGHDWPGKDSGVPHPTEGELAEQPYIQRKSLSAYHRNLADLLVQAVNHRGCRYRTGKNSIILYPPDGSEPYTVHARSSDRQVKTFAAWYEKHVIAPLFAEAATDTEGSASTEELTRLAQQVNDPVEHPDPPKVKAPTPAPPAKKAAPPRSVTEPGGWGPYVNRENEQHEHVEHDGHGHFRCRTCLGTESAWSGEVNGVGGHVRMWHRDRSGLYTPEAEQKRAESRARNAVENEVKVAMRALARIIGVETVDPKKIRDLEAEVRSLREENGRLKRGGADVDAANRRADEAEARLALIQEAMRA